MSYFAEIDEENVVLRVVRVPDTQEHRGEEFLQEDLKLGGRWIQTSFNASIRKQFAAPGMFYSEQLDMFISEKPFASWTLDDEGDWTPPIDMPLDGSAYAWDEELQDWEELDEDVPA